MGEVEKDATSCTAFSATRMTMIQKDKRIIMDGWIYCVGPHKPIASYNTFVDVDSGQEIDTTTDTIVATCGMKRVSTVFTTNTSDSESPFPCPVSGPTNIARQSQEPKSMDGSVVHNHCDAVVATADPGRRCCCLIFVVCFCDVLCWFECLGLMRDQTSP